MKLSGILLSATTGHPGISLLDFPTKVSFTTEVFHMGDDELKQDPPNQPEDLDGQDPQRRDEEYESHHEVQPLNDETG